MAVLTSVTRLGTRSECSLVTASSTASVYTPASKLSISARTTSVIRFVLASTELEMVDSVSRSPCFSARQHFRT